MPTKQKKEIKRLLEEIDETYWGPEERALIDQALALSQEIGDEKLEYKVRIRLTSSAARTGDNDAMLSSFAWCLAKHDADPRTFPNQISDQLAGLMWQFKWMTEALDSSPIFTLTQCEAMLDDMEAHYVRENLGRSAVVTARFQHAWNVGAIEQAKDLRSQLLATPRDDHSHCDACSRSELAGFALETGEEELALQLVDEIVEGGFTCGEEPEHALSRTLIAKLRAGRTQDAIDSHMRSYRLARRNPDNISIVADNMVFCAVTGNQARGLAMVERHIAWLAHDTLNEDGQLNMLVAIAMVLEGVTRAGYGDQVVRAADAPSLERFFGPRDQVWTAVELAGVVWQTARRSAQAFDARNGNDYRSAQIEQTKTLLDSGYDLPILTEVFLEPDPTTKPPESPQQWLDLSEVYGFADLADETIDTSRRALDGGDPTQRSRALQNLIVIYIQQDEVDQARELLPSRLQALRDEGRLAQAELEDRVGLAMFGLVTEDGIARLEAELVRLSDSEPEVLADVEITLAGSLIRQEDNQMTPRAEALLESAIAHAASRPRLQAAALRGLAAGNANQGNLEKAVEYVDRVVALDVSDGCTAMVLMMRARLMGGLERYEEGAANADAATKIYARYQTGHPLIGSTFLASALMQDARRFDDEVVRLRYALREANRLEIATTGIRYRLGRALTSAGHPLEAIEILWEVLKDEEEAEVEPASRGETCQALALAFEADRRYGNAVAMCEQAAELFQEAAQPANAAEMLRRKGNIQRAFEMYDDAIETLSQAWRLVEDQDDRGIRVLVLEAWAFAKASAGQEAACQDVDQAIGLVETDPDGPYPWKIADLIDSKARILGDLSRHDEAAATYRKAAEGYAEAGDLASAARARHFAAQCLAGELKQPDDAIPIWRQALTDAEAALAAGADLSELRDSILLKLSETLDALGRDIEANEVRSRINPD